MTQRISPPPRPANPAGIHSLDPNPAGRNTVLFLHGLGADCESWPLQMEALAAAGWRPVALDLPGFGKSLAYRGRWTVARTARAVRDFAVESGLGRFTAAGISMGGTVALQLALDYPDHLENLILINTFAQLKPRSAGQALYFIRRFMMISRGDRREQARFVADRVFPGGSQRELQRSLEEKILQANERVYQQAMLSLGLFRVEKRLGEIKLPTLVISGELDTTVALDRQQKVAGAIPNARHVVIKGGGHGVTVDSPEDVNRAILAFLVK